MNQINITNLLDKTRIDNGTENMKDLFDSTAKKNIKKAVELINEQNVSFTSLFLLQDKINEFNITKELSYKNRVALGFIDGIRDEKKDISFATSLSSEHTHSTQTTLKWILESGYTDDGLNNDFDEVLDKAAILLIKSFNDNSELPIIVDLVFDRYKRGFYIHDLVWALFESRELKSLYLLAEHLKSTDKKEVRLANKLLSFIPGISINSPKSNEEKYTYFIKWFEENSPFLYYTGESFQLTSEPIPYEVNLEAKYLCKKILIDTGEFVDPLTNKENNVLNSFKKLNNDAKTLLSSFSYMTYRKDNTWWKKWIRYPIASQINIAKAKGGSL
jgi:hypothetical protein